MHYLMIYIILKCERNIYGDSVEGKRRDGVQTALPLMVISLTNMDQLGAHLNRDTEPFCLTFHLTFWINLLLQPWNQHKISMLLTETFRALYSGSIRLNHTKLQIFKHFNLKNDNFRDLAEEKPQFEY